MVVVPHLFEGTSSIFSVGEGYLCQLRRLPTNVPDHIPGSHIPHATSGAHIRAPEGSMPAPWPLTGPRPPSGCQHGAGRLTFMRPPPDLQPGDLALHVCEDSRRHWTVTTNFCISGTLLLVTPNHTPSPAPRVEKPEVGTRAHIKPGLNYTRPYAPYGPLTSPCQTQNGKEPESMNNKQHMSETHPTAYANQ